jgi:sugar diacid utilization regulator
LIAPRIAEFVADDIATGGVLIETLKAFAASDLSCKVTAHLLHVHLNTVRYRLAKITELTGRDPRQVRNLIELRIAAELISDSSV